MRMLCNQLSTFCGIGSIRKQQEVWLKLRGRFWVRGSSEVLAELEISSIAATATPVHGLTSNTWRKLAPKRSFIILIIS